MKCLSNAMFLGAHSGKNENDEVYYYGAFIDKSTNKPFNLYYSSMDFLKTLTPYKDYDLKFNLYKNKDNQWKLSTKDV